MRLPSGACWQGAWPVHGGRSVDQHPAWQQAETRASISHIRVSKLLQSGLVPAQRPPPSHPRFLPCSLPAGWAAPSSCASWSAGLWATSGRAATPTRPAAAGCGPASWAAWATPLRWCTTSSSGEGWGRWALEMGRGSEAWVEGALDWRVGVGNFAPVKGCAVRCRCCGL